MHVDGTGSGQRVDQYWVIELIGEHDLSTASMVAEWMAGIDDSAQLIQIDLRRPSSSIQPSLEHSSALRRLSLRPAGSS